MEPLVLLTDQPIGEDACTIGDGLGFNDYAQALARAAMDTAGPFTIGVFGEWGTGKTSLMRLIQKKLMNNTDIITVWFNAWSYEQEEHPLLPLIATIIGEVEKNKSFLKSLGDSGRALIRGLRAIAYGVSAKSKLKIPGFAEIEASFVAKDMIEGAKKRISDPLLERSIYYNAFQFLKKVHLSGNKRIVILIDDLDRCFPDKAIKLLESIKLVLSQPGFIFILGVAKKVIEGYLQHRYQKEYGIKDFQGQLYLDKIVQLPFYIPPHKGRMKEFSENLLACLKSDDKILLKEIIPIISISIGSNPRTVVRFINNLLIDRAINNILAENGILENIPINFFAITRALQIRWPNIFSVVINSESICEEIHDCYNQNLSDRMKSSNLKFAEILHNLIIDDELRNLLFSNYGKEWLKNHFHRNAAVQFLRTQRIESFQTQENPEKKFDAYLSYNFSDSKVVSEIRNIFNKNGLQIFDPLIDLYFGQSITSIIKDTLKTSKNILFFIGQETIKSKLIFQEIGFVVGLLENHKDIQIITILLPDTHSDAVPEILKSYFCVDLNHKEITEETIKPLIDAILFHSALY
ncbi:TIR domain-containing protein [candidate division KSB1 bacterium]|nr:TIR domain-containing protein [candidate division KSB1 bacterium]